jgi:hypothetical protein
MSRQQVGVDHAGREVKLTFGRTVASLYYRDAFQIAQWLRLHASEARRENRDRSTLTFDDSRYDKEAREPYSASVELREVAPPVDRGSTLATKMNVEVVHHGEIVDIQMGAHTGGLHNADALPFSNAMRAHARAVKRSLGDTATIHLAAGILTDAEANYKRGI